MARRKRRHDTSRSQEHRSAPATGQVTGSGPGRPIAVTVAVLACVGLGTSPGCTALFDAGTSHWVQPADAANQPQTATTSQVMVRAAFILGPGPGQYTPYPEGGDAALYLTLVNPTRRTDQLIGASSPAAAKTVISSHGAQQITVPPIDPSIGDHDHVDIGRPPYSPHTLTLTELTRPLRNGSIVSVTLTFQQAGDVSLKVPVTPRSGARESLPPAQQPQ